MRGLGRSIGWAALIDWGPTAFCPELLAAMGSALAVLLGLLLVGRAEIVTAGPKERLRQGSSDVHAQG